MKFRDKKYLLEILQLKTFLKSGKNQEKSRTNPEKNPRQQIITVENTEEFWKSGKKSEIENDFKIITVENIEEFEHPKKFRDKKIIFKIVTVENIEEFWTSGTNPEKFRDKDIF